ncbi:MAG: O-antigen ligase family protein [Solirubrobacterales bacterium]|nr:O-antigen ligase family protein [Solirubrobacterales bacterium]
MASRAALDTLPGPVLTAAVLVGLGVLAIALLERRTPVDPGFALRVKRAVGVAAVVLAVVGVAGALVAVGDPVDRVQTKWDEFKRGAGVATDGQAGFTNGFGGARYDYYRVALDLVEENPVHGVGADNFAQDYAARGRALEFPAFVHSIELRTLVHTGILGGLLLGLALGAALLAAWRATRVEGGRALSAAVSVAATMCALQWAVQGSADWFWEFPALGGAAFALLGVACGLAPHRSRPAEARDAPAEARDAPAEARDAPAEARDAPAEARGAPRGLRLAVLGVAGVVLVAALASLVLPWTSAIEVQRASKVWPADAPAAFGQLELAADLNPLSSQPALYEGTIALRLNRLDRARTAFTEALERDSREAYATLALGVIASQQGDRRRALAFLRRAAVLNRQDAVTLGALDRVRAGERIEIPALIEQFQILARNADR